MILHLKFIGVLLILLAIVHAIFPKYFHWKTDLAPISLVNRQMMYIHTLFIALTVLLMGILCVGFSQELVNSKLGKIIALGLAIFWGIRLLVQFFGYSSQLWKGKTFETIVHIAFIFLWTYLTTIFAWVYWE